MKALQSPIPHQSQSNRQVLVTRGDVPESSRGLTGLAPGEAQFPEGGGELGAKGRHGVKGVRRGG